MSVREPGPVDGLPDPLAYELERTLECAAYC
ncbi:hypothetical protein FHS43_000544 [Streptosporangium becharense]|uniref:Uncharacterized protein n=1 Tax=Streptosporangium becharense TaxID=1816182 RepID=A0A7W9MKQ8_9ACTN|nr:hypothetical protein [Streptosporangium becharense]MBB5823799.1 hypothetical protein [Streptosporangium becharense]